MLLTNKPCIHTMYVKYTPIVSCLRRFVHTADGAVLDKKVIDIIAEELSVDPSEITEDSNLVEDLDADSLAVVDLVMSIEDAFNVEIPDTEVENLKTVGEIVQFIEEHQGQ